MAEEALLKYAQPFLIGIGLVVVLNLWSIIQAFLSARRNKDSKIEASIEKLKESDIRIISQLELLKKDMNNIGRMVKALKD